MSTTTQNMNYRQGGVIPPGDANQVIPAGAVGHNPQGGLNVNGELVCVNDKKQYCLRHYSQFPTPKLIWTIMPTN